MSKGRFEIVHIGGLTIGRATYQPGWKWSVDVGRGAGAEYCTVEHVGLVVSGTATAAFEDGETVQPSRLAISARPPVSRARKCSLAIAVATSTTAVRASARGANRSKNALIAPVYVAR